MIDTTTKFIISNLYRDLFAPLERESIHTNCFTVKHNEYICSVQQLYNSQSKMCKCEMEILRRTSTTVPVQCTRIKRDINSYWSQLYDKKQWLYTLNQEQAFNLVCQDKITPVKLKDTGIVIVPNGCKLTGKTFYINQLNVLNSSIHESYISNNIELPLEIPTREVSTPINTNSISVDYNKDLDQLEQKIDFQKNDEQKGISSISSHDIHHYTMIYIILTISIIIGIFGVILSRHQIYKSKSTETTTGMTDTRPQPLPRSLTNPIRQDVHV